jgi:hypothetical protein
MDLGGFFNVLSFALQFAPTHPSETALRERFVSIGIVTGQPIEVRTLSPDMQAAMEAGMRDGQQQDEAWRQEGAEHQSPDEYDRSHGSTSIACR